MLCEKCGKRDARVKITRIINGVSETHHYCRECAEEMTGKTEIKSNEWSQAVFKLLREMFMQASHENNKELQEKAYKPVKSSGDVDNLAQKITPLLLHTGISAFTHTFT